MNDIKEEGRFIKLVASHFTVLRPLYPNKELSFMNLAKISGVDEANLSRKVRLLKKEGLINVRKINEKTSRPYSAITLTTDVQRLIQSVIKIKGLQNTPPALVEERYLEEAILLLTETGVQSLAADQIQIISRDSVVPSGSQFFKFIGRNLLDEKLDAVRSVILLSLQNILRNSSYEARQKIAEKVLRTLRAVKDKFPRERPGIVAQEILDEFFLDDVSYEVLSQEYIKRIIDRSDQGNSLRNRLLDRFPEMKIDLRSRLLKEYSKADSESRMRIESEFIALY
jgi:DNA-binding MarR family transcriptional regulator